ASIKHLNGSDFPRQELCTALNTYNKSIGNNEALPAIEKLADNAVAVVTGQQSGLMSGPLYTIYKIITSIKLAAAIESDKKVPAVAIYWNASEDHDLSEIQHALFPEKRYTAEFPNEGIAAEALDAENAKAEIAAFLETVPDDFKEKIETLLTHQPEKYGEFSSSIIAALFKDYGLIILEPKILRPIAKELLKEFVSKNSAIRSSLESSAARLETLSISAAFTNPATGLFHINTDGKRRQIRLDGKNFSIDENAYTEAELLELIDRDASRISTSAFLRPVLQSKIIPTVAYVAGPGEYKYHLQLKDLFNLFDTEIPYLHMRNHATLFSGAETRNLEKLGIGKADIFRGIEAFYQKAELPESYESKHRDTENQFKAAIESLSKNIGELAGDKVIQGFEKRLNDEIQKVHKRASKEYQRQQETDNNRLDKLFKTLYPNGPQERNINIFYFLTKNPDLIRLLMETLEPNEERHYLIEC
ncbi:MAG: bacillithiol biosynthesis cysteine-adding enzyme BshC, partial [Lentisphaeria bacterium]|nr:bacillithiol biosynthesis cysteine-adding enzyme BshC [Lentisphaeria bacterium]NQZ67759.1 bacillithiol biosynthesis cysteine-adding enzyme BshC [Lentisphaeria bacterium]